MLFNSIDFAIFLPITFFVYWSLEKKGLRSQNLFILFASYVFYGWWDYRFLSLILLSSIVDYLIGLRISKTELKKKKKLLLFLSLILNLGLLGFFKYYNFFIDSLITSYSLFGRQLNISTLNIILPVGISFYTFQTLSYTIDVYKGKMTPTKSFISFAAFVSFFPQLVAGPIERASHLLPQFETKRLFSYKESINGVKLIIYGLFKKIVIADSLSVYVDNIYSNPEMFNGSILALGTIYFAFQIYCDFSGYSDIAIGTAKLFGFDLMVNFRMPYFSKSIGEFWERWHISLSTWFRDYVYIPLGGSRVSTIKHFRNLLLTFTVSGFWHGANWTFIIWGLMHGLFYLPEVITKKYPFFRLSIESVAFIKTKEFFQSLSLFILVCFAWIFFRSNSLAEAVSITTKIFLEFDMSKLTEFRSGLVLLVPFIIYEYVMRNTTNGLDLNQIGLRKFGRLFTYIIFIGIIILQVSGNDKSFIYFQF